MDKKFIAKQINSYLKEKKSLSKKFGISEKTFFGRDKKKKLGWFSKFCYLYLTLKGFSIRSEIIISPSKIKVDKKIKEK